MKFSTTALGDTPVTSPRRPPRLSSVDFFRVCAIFAVVCIHTTPPENQSLPWEKWFNELCRFAVPYFFIAAGYFFSLATSDGKPIVQVFSRYAQRIVLLFLGWALFYAVVPPFVGGQNYPYPARLVEHLQDMIRFPHSFVLTGNIYHLWFLSALLQGIAIVAFFQWLKRPRLGLAFAITLLLFALLTGAYRETPVGIPLPLNTRSGLFFSTFFVAVGAMLARRTKPIPLGAALTIFFVGLILHLAEIWFLSRAGAQPVGSFQLVFGTVPFAVGLMLIALARPGLRGFGIHALGRYTLGIFVLHVYVIEVIKALPWLSALTEHSIAFSLVVFTVTSTIVVTMGRFEWLKSFVL